MPKSKFNSILTFAILASVPALAQIVPETPQTEEAEPKQPKPYTFAALVLNTPFKSVVKNSSFKNSASTASRQIQFLGILTINGLTEYGIYDPVAQRSYWLKLRERDSSGIYVENYDAKQKSITLQSNSTGRMVLTLATQDEKPLAVIGGTYRSIAAPAPQQQSKSAPPQQTNNRNSRRK